MSIKYITPRRAIAGSLLGFALVAVGGHAVALADQPIDAEQIEIAGVAASATGEVIHQITGDAIDATPWRTAIEIGKTIEIDGMVYVIDWATASASATI